MRVLVVEDEIEIRDLMSLHLRRHGFEVDAVDNGQVALTQLLNFSYDLVVLDWMLPGLSGPEIAEKIRMSERAQSTPILMVTARAEPQDVTYGLEKGADDYVVKPFDLTVFIARAKALLRRSAWVKSMTMANAGPSSAGSDSRNVLTLGTMIVDADRFEAQIDNEPMDLTRSEFKLLHALLLNQGRVLSRLSLIKEIQGDGVNVVGRTVDTHIFGLRKKMGVYSDCIETIRGVGYRVNYKPEANQ